MSEEHLTPIGDAAVRCCWCGIDAPAASMTMNDDELWQCEDGEACGARVRAHVADQSPVPPQPHSLKILGGGLAGWSNRVWVDGQESNAVTSVDLHMSVHEINRATLDVALQRGVDVDTVAEVTVPSETRDLLIRLGWTPPETQAPQIAMPNWTPELVEEVFQQHFTEALSKPLRPQVMPPFKPVVIVDKADLDAVLAALEEPLTMPTSRPIAEWLESSTTLRAASRASARIRASLPPGPYPFYSLPEPRPDTSDESPGGAE